jgi:hypothetical protein
MPCVRARGGWGVVAGMRSRPARQLKTPPLPPPPRAPSVFRCRCSGVGVRVGVRSVSGRCCQLASAATAWVGELGLTQPAEVTRPSMLLTALGLRPATVGGGGGRWAVGEA